MKAPPSKRQKTEADEGKEEETKEEEEEEKKEDEDEKMDEEVGDAGEAGEGEAVTLRKNRQVEEKVPFTDEEAESVVAEWMEKQNRPYSV